MDNKLLMLIAIILIAINGFSIQINNFKFEWLGVIDVLVRIFSK